jgi:tRNA pseudouridine55 synthase
MGRRRKGTPVDGWVVLDKPAGMTSTQAVGKVRWLLDAQKAGHAGTLDPLATGILPIALGQATKTVPFAVDGIKAYRFTVRWGQETDTDDAEGRIVAESPSRPDAASIAALLPRFHGEILQVPPRYSAIKIDGQRAYDLARGGEAVDLEPRPVVIDRLAIVATPSPDETILEAVCGRGTYVRAIARDLGRLLSCCGHVVALRRTRVGAFTEDRAVTLEALTAAGDADDGGARLAACLLPVEAALSELIEVKLAQLDAARLARGQSVILRGRDAPLTSGEVYVTCRGGLVALAFIEKGELRPTRVFT